MKLADIRMYYKAAVLVPFYTSCAFAIPAILNGSEPLIRLAIASGITGVLSTSIFLNCYKEVRENALYCTLSFFLLPAISLAYILNTRINWGLFTKLKTNIFVDALTVTICFIHLVGLFISFIDLRRSVRISMEMEKDKPEETREEKMMLQAHES